MGNCATLTTRPGRRNGGGGIERSGNTTAVARPCRAEPGVMIFSMICSTVMPSASALKLGMMRWRRTGAATASMSSIVTCRRPLHQGAGLAGEDQVLAARGPAPSSASGGRSRWRRARSGGWRG